MINRLTIVLPFYMNPGMLALQYSNWLAWSNDLKARLKVIIVDDGSPSGPAVDVPRPQGVDISIFRVTEDRPWHQHGARNLGAHEAPEGWILLTDMDHVLRPDPAAALFAAELDASAVYMLDRVEADTGLPTMKDGRPKPHPNSFVMTRETFWRVGGYDEDYCGVYGTDRLFRDRAFERARRGHLSVPLTRFWRDIVPDASTTTLNRKSGRDADAKAKVRAAKAARGEAEVIKTLQFQWEQVA